MVSTWVNIHTLPFTSHIYCQACGMETTAILDYENGWANESATTELVQEMDIWILIGNELIGVTIFPRDSERTFVSIRDVVDTVFYTVHEAFAGILTSPTQWSGLVEFPFSDEFLLIL